MERSTFKILFYFRKKKLNKDGKAAPRTGIAEKSKATKKLAVLFDSADAAVKNMDFAVGIIKLTQPDFYNGYNTSRKLVDTSTGNLALKATAIDFLL